MFRNCYTEHVATWPLTGCTFTADRSALRSALSKPDLLTTVCVWHWELRHHTKECIAPPIYSVTTPLSCRVRWYLGRPEICTKPDTIQCRFCNYLAVYYVILFCQIWPSRLFPLATSQLVTQSSRHTVNSSPVNSSHSCLVTQSTRHKWAHHNGLTKSRPHDRTVRGARSRQLCGRAAWPQTIDLRAVVSCWDLVN